MQGGIMKNISSSCISYLTGKFSEVSGMGTIAGLMLNNK